MLKPRNINIMRGFLYHFYAFVRNLNVHHHRRYHRHHEYFIC